MNPALLIETQRNNITEKQHFGFIIAVDKEENIIFKIGDDENKNFWFRSAAKPLQASIILESGAYEKFNFTLRELAVCCASHAGTEEHTEAVRSILNKICLNEENLQCGAHEPLDKETRNYLIRQNKSPTQIYNNCSGKHAGMLAVCVANNWNIKDYLDFEHPLQKKITENISKFCNIDKNSINTGTDGCSAPIHALPHYKMGVGFLNLFSDKNYELLKQAFIQNPYLIGGNERLDTDIIKLSSGKLISKVAAEGLCITVNLEKNQALIVKILDADMKARAITTLEILKQLNWLSEKELSTPEAKKLYNFNIMNHKNIIVGEIIPKFLV